MILLDRRDVAIVTPASRAAKAATTAVVPQRAIEPANERGMIAANKPPPMPVARTVLPASARHMPVEVARPRVISIVATVGSDITAIAPETADNPPPSELRASLQDASANMARAPSRVSPDPSISAWAIIRPSSAGRSLATNGQLGASQAGLRIQHPLWGKADRRPVAINVRLSSPLAQNSGKEAGVGVALRFARRLPAELVVERRIAIDREGRNALAIIAAGGFDDRPMPAGLRLSGYLQGGVVGAAQRDGFIDGAARIERPLGTLRMGAGLWGGAQPGVNRLDAGPLIAVTRQIGPAAIRLSAEYRWRVTGHAQPGSGPALSIATSF